MKLFIPAHRMTWTRPPASSQIFVPPRTSSDSRREEIMSRQWWCSSSVRSHKATRIQEIHTTLTRHQIHPWVEEYYRGETMQRYLEEQDGDANAGGDDYLYYDDTIFNNSVPCPSWAPIVGFTGIACAVVFASEFWYYWILKISRSLPFLIAPPSSILCRQTLAELMAQPKQGSASCPWEYGNPSC